MVVTSVPKSTPVGFHFPFSKRADGFPSADGPPNIYASTIKQILLTLPGERVMRQTFGSNLKALLFSPMPSAILEDAIKTAIRDSIRIWEPRVALQSVEVFMGTAKKDSAVLVKVTIITPVGISVVEVPFNG
jgi:phage baseplate assembly protein W